MAEWRFDREDAERRRDEAAEEAKRLEDAGDGHAAGAAWERFERIRGAIAAQERIARVRERHAARSSS